MNRLFLCAAESCKHLSVQKFMERISRKEREYERETIYLKRIKTEARKQKNWLAAITFAFLQMSSTDA